MCNMYHGAYPHSLVLGSHLQGKLSPILMVSDLPLVTIDPLSSVTSFRHVPQLYASPILLDVASMKRIPLLNLEPMNCYLPPWPKARDVSRSERRFSKDHSVDSGNQSDAGASLSRSSTPSSSVAVPAKTGDSAAVTEPTVKNTSRDPVKGNFSQLGRRHTSYHQRHSTSTTNSSMLINSNFMHQHWDSVSQQIWKHYVKSRQTEEMYFKKIRLRNAVQTVLNESFTNSGLWVVGSSVNGLGTNTSDMDMCLVLTTTEIDQQTGAMILLKCVQTILQNNCSFIKSTELITAKVPILKFTDKLGIQVDLNIDNTVGIANTVLIRDYCCLDWRVQPLVLVIKKWAQDCDINNAKDMTLSSYSLTLMVLHFLQCGCRPPVLPCLQKMRPDTHKNLPKIKSKNTESLGELLLGFFDYFSNRFDFEHDVMSIRLGCKLPKYQAINYRSTKNKRGHWKYICIEEPFNRTNTACAVYDANSFAKILTAFRTTCVKLQISKDISAIIKL